jgi:hypothetical protein
MAIDLHHAHVFASNIEATIEWWRRHLEAKVLFDIGMGRLRAASCFRRKKARRGKPAGRRSQQEVGRDGDRHAHYGSMVGRAQESPQPGEDEPQIVADRGEDHVGGVAGVGYRGQAVPTVSRDVLALASSSCRLRRRCADSGCKVGWTRSSLGRMPSSAEPTWKD